MDKMQIYRKAKKGEKNSHYTLYALSSFILIQQTIL